MKSSTSYDTLACEVRSARPEDLEDISHIHMDRFAQFFMAQVGPGLLREYFEVIRRSDVGSFWLPFSRSK